MSRLNAGSIAVHRRPLKIAEVVAAVLAEQPEYREQVGVEAPPDLPSVYGDHGLLQRCLANLLHNAVTHGAAPLAVCAAAGPDEVEIRVIDHGPGIPAERRDCLFTPFRHHTGAGLGLGLAVVQGFAEAMRGTIRATETPGGGTTMILSLPRVVRDA
nr:MULTISPECIES: ATP-binding protein [unclassified Corynebacterium]